MVTLGQLVPPTSSNSFDSTFVGWLIVSAIVFLNMLVSLKTLRRQPSVDVDLTKINAALEKMNESIKTATTSLTEQDKALAALRERLTGELANVDATQRGVEEIQHRLSKGDEVMSQLREKQSANAAVIMQINGSVHEQNTRLDGLQKSVTSILINMPRIKA